MLAPAAVERAALWPGYIPQLDDAVEHNQLSDMEKVWLSASRIAKADVVRLFSTRVMQSRLLQALTFLETRIGAYSQGMAFCTAFVLLFLPDAKAVAIILRLATDERYLKGCGAATARARANAHSRIACASFWHHEPIAFATDAYVFDHLLSVHVPDVHAHLAAALLFPETYCQKCVPATVHYLLPLLAHSQPLLRRWFIGLCVHVLPFSALLDFYDAFLKEGRTYVPLSVAWLLPR